MKGTPSGSLALFCLGVQLGTNVVLAGGCEGFKSPGWSLGGAVQWEDKLSEAQPSCPKSSVNFFTFSRSSAFTVGRVVARERSISA